MIDYWNGRIIKCLEIVDQVISKGENFGIKKMSLNLYES